MSPNGRRAWRRAAKKLRREMGRRWRSQKEWLYGKRWSEFVPDLEAHRSHITGAWFKRHGFTEQCQTLDPVRVYIGLWGTADGDGVEYVVHSKPCTPRSLVGRTNGARKRKARYWMECERLHQKAQDFQEVVDRSVGRKSSLRTIGHTPISLRNHYRIGERLRPCPGCANCDRHMASYGFFHGGDPRYFTPDEECSTEAERELHRQHCEAWEKGERPTVKVSGIEWTEALNYTGRDGQPKTCPAGYKFVERAAYGLGVTRATNDQEGRFCDGSGVLPARRS